MPVGVAVAPRFMSANAATGSLAGLLLPAKLGLDARMPIILPGDPIICVLLGEAFVPAKPSSRSANPPRPAEPALEGD